MLPGPRRPCRRRRKFAMRKWWRGLAAGGALLVALAAAVALTVAGLRPATAHAHGQPPPSSSAADSRRPPPRFGPGGAFKVALFADLHYGEDAWTDWGPAQDAASDRVMAAVLDAENPGPSLPMPTLFFPSRSAAILSRTRLTNYSIRRLCRARARDPDQTSWCTSATW